MPRFCNVIPTIFATGVSSIRMDIVTESSGEIRPSDVRRVEVQVMRSLNCLGNGFVRYQFFKFKYKNSFLIFGSNTNLNVNIFNLRYVVECVKKLYC